eukprot:scaffold26577_cov70-Skeletonema_dohrnii-CCMP3373.AAC.7
MQEGCMPANLFSARPNAELKLKLNRSLAYLNLSLSESFASVMSLLRDMGTYLLRRILTLYREGASARTPKRD